MLSRLKQTSSFFNKMIITPVPCLEDNYAYLILDEKSKKAAAVDPAEPSNILKALKAYPDYKLSMILTTHHHWDHAGGNEELLSKFTSGLPCYGGSENVEGVNHLVNSDTLIELGGIKIRVLETPGHTMDHICYYIDNGEDRAVFTGDCLFSSGCGRFFEGTPEDMWGGFSKLKALPEDTKVYFGHEYTRSNLKFAAHVEQNNEDIKQKIAYSESVKCTTPSTMKNELLTNPFLRVDIPEVAKLIDSDPTASVTKVLGKLRKMKDNF
ncbi:hydroxyacylglutathione hydrolase [Pilobolus umbonatus]|nr:hydroxyacylglutathione hydrolase [Pilobolus umbonatus]